MSTPSLDSWNDSSMSSGSPDAADGLGGGAADQQPVWSIQPEANSDPGSELAEPWESDLGALGPGIPEWETVPAVESPLGEAAVAAGGGGGVGGSKHSTSTSGLDAQTLFPRAPGKAARKSAKSSGGAGGGSAEAAAEAGGTAEDRKRRRQVQAQRKYRKREKSRKIQVGQDPHGVPAPVPPRPPRRRRPCPTA
eukprot:SAG22_NODE_1258_length_4983_cov_2.401925_1_plen_194_part_00